MQDLSDLPKLPTNLPKLPSDLPKLPKLPKLPDFSQPKPVPREQEPITPPPAPTLPSEPTPEEQSNFGWLTNLPKSTFNLVKSVVYDLPKAAVESGIHYIQNPEEYSKDLSRVFARNNGLGGMLKEQMVDYYTKDFWHNFNEDPAHLLADLATVLSAGGGAAAKAGEVGKIASLAKVGEAAAKAATYIDPVVLAGKAAGRVARPALEALGYGKFTQELNSLRAQLAANQAIDMNNEIAKVIFGKLTPEENQRLLRLIRWGDRGEQALAGSANDLVGKRFRVWREMVTGGDEPLFKDMHLLDDAQAQRANAIKMAEYSQGHYKELGLSKPITAAEAKAMMAAGTHNPTFMSSYRLKSQAGDLFEALNRANYRGGLLARFERLVGGKAPLEDVDEIMARQIASKHDAIMKIKTSRAVLALMAEKAQRHFVPNGDLTALIPKDFAPLQEAFHEKYWGDMIRAGGAAADELVKAVATGKSVAESQAIARQLFSEHPETLAQVASKGVTYVPRHVAAWLNRELAPISPLGRLYDSSLARFKGLVTVFNPRFWGSVVFGNAMLGLFYGVSPDYARIAYKYREFLPPELRAVSRAEYFLAQKGVYSRVANSLGEFAQQLDNLYRLPIFAKEIAESSAARMKFAGGAFFQSKDQILQAVKYYGAAPERLLSSRLAIDKLRQEFATGLLEEKQVNQQLAALEPKLRAANAAAEAEMLPPPAIKGPMGSVTIDPTTGATLSRERWYEQVDRGLTPKTDAQKAAIDLRNEYGNLEIYQKGLREDAIHRLAELGELQKRVPGLLQDAQVADRAIEVGNRFYGSYLRLSPFERKTLRRMLPFYTFNKAMTSLAFRLPFLYPKRVFIGAHLAQAWNDLTSDENSFMPARLKDYVPVMARPDGSVVAISTGYMNPLSSAKVGDFAELPLPSVFNPLKSNPVVALILKMNGAIPEWSAKPLSPGEYATRLDNGVVVQWTGKGFKTVISQPSVFKSLFDLFPQGQLIDKLVHPYAQTDRGWLFNPDPIAGPDGQPRYPRELLDTIMGMVIPTQTYNVDEVKANERAKMNAIAKSYQKDLRFATPVRRDQILTVLRAWGDEKNRKWIKD